MFYKFTIFCWLTRIANLDYHFKLCHEVWSLFVNLGCQAARGLRRSLLHVLLVSQHVSTLSWEGCIVIALLISVQTLIESSEL